MYDMYDKETKEELEALDEIVEAAKELRENWMNGVVAQAMYRDSLVKKMQNARLIPEIIK